MTLASKVKAFFLTGIRQTVVSPLCNSPQMPILRNVDKELDFVGNSANLVADIVLRAAVEM